jgi:hypothetical protein
MTDTTRSEYFDDFEIITDVNETAFPEQNESKNMETNNEAEMPGQGKPTPVPRSRGTKVTNKKLFHQDVLEGIFVVKFAGLKGENELAIIGPGKVPLRYNVYQRFWFGFIMSWLVYGLLENGFKKQEVTGDEQTITVWFARHFTDHDVG